MSKRRMTQIGFLVAWILISACAQRDPIVGTWEGKSILGEDLELTFTGDGRLEVKFVKDGAINYGTYAVDRTQTPGHFNYQLDGRSPIQTIFEQADEKSLAFEEVTSGDSRPSAFGRYKLTFRRKAG